jgi:4-amino-4-deoxy-L-arabinose transferase-like glycosyltransferase
LLTSPRRQLIVLTAATVACLLPFAGKAFHIDDPLFVWTAQQIVESPLDPYGFTVNWSLAEQPMHEVTKNPPLAAYYLALAASLMGWSEVALHLAFLLPAIGVVLGVWQLARRLSDQPVVAGLIALVSPVFLVSATSVMSDTAMLALWVWAVVLWIDGLEADCRWRLALAALLAGMGALTKYLGIGLIPLLLVHGLVRRRRLGPWALHLLIPVAILAGYQAWTHALYGRGLLFGAGAFAADWRSRYPVPPLERGFVGLVFAGGCVLPGLLLAPALWARKALAWVAAAAAAMAVVGYWVLPSRVEGSGIALAIQAGLLAAGGVIVVALAIGDYRARRSADSVLLGLWVVGTVFFMIALNWTVNGRSVLPLLPAAAVLVARRIDAGPRPRRNTVVAVALGLSAVVSLVVTAGDVAVANAQRAAVDRIVAAKGEGDATVWFQGHWGFQYYMERRGGRSADIRTARPRDGDLIVLPQNNTRVVGVLPEAVASREWIEVEVPALASTMHKKRGAGFYSAGYGPLPFTFGKAPKERYEVCRLGHQP